ncbi:hypothetical protein TGDOM2_294060 [Toxoplasma gondii GAB2-2007-GAL-DOM2]|uniref:Uncharacterized protein n=2 Tax=Toxoplasma gondii TaxID=5811 RepID=A0A086KRN4_TOXGO|nr:hypothetical protein TGDOM2_294060 [Toxoplasma gondii GAB2-2007-GAL-DOM2]KFG47052.1 hypothetical protein TGFOU_294060 [Toxoplasma gondii FOU]
MALSESTLVQSRSAVAKKVGGAGLPATILRRKLQDETAATLQVWDALYVLLNRGTWKAPPEGPRASVGAAHAELLFSLQADDARENRLNGCEAPSLAGGDGWRGPGEEVLRARQPHASSASPRGESLSAEGRRKADVDWEKMLLFLSRVTPEKKKSSQVSRTAGAQVDETKRGGLARGKKLRAGAAGADVEGRSPTGTLQVGTDRLSMRCPDASRKQRTPGPRLTRGRGDTAEAVPRQGNVVQEKEAAFAKASAYSQTRGDRSGPHTRYGGPSVEGSASAPVPCTSSLSPSSASTVSRSAVPGLQVGRPVSARSEQSGAASAFAPHSSGSWETEAAFLLSSSVSQSRQSQERGETWWREGENPPSSVPASSGPDEWVQTQGAFLENGEANAVEAARGGIQGSQSGVHTPVRGRSRGRGRGRKPTGGGRGAKSKKIETVDQERKPEGRRGRRTAPQSALLRNDKWPDPGDGEASGVRTPRGVLPPAGTGLLAAGDGASLTAFSLQGEMEGEGAGCQDYDERLADLIFAPEGGETEAKRDKSEGEKGDGDAAGDLLDDRVWFSETDGDGANGDEHGEGQRHQNTQQSHDLDVDEALSLLFPDEVQESSATSPTPPGGEQSQASPGLPAVCTGIFKENDDSFSPGLVNQTFEVSAFAPARVVSSGESSSVSSFPAPQEATGVLPIAGAEEAIADGQGSEDHLSSSPRAASGSVTTDVFSSTLEPAFPLASDVSATPFASHSPSLLLSEPSSFSSLPPPPAPCPSLTVVSSPPSCTSSSVSPSSSLPPSSPPSSSPPASSASSLASAFSQSASPPSSLSGRCESCDSLRRELLAVRLRGFREWSEKYKTLEAALEEKISLIHQLERRSEEMAASLETEKALRAEERSSRKRSEETAASLRACLRRLEEERERRREEEAELHQLLVCTQEELRRERDTVSRLERLARLDAQQIQDLSSRLGLRPTTSSRDANRTYTQRDDASEEDEGEGSGGNEALGAVDAQREEELEKGQMPWGANVSPRTSSARSLDDDLFGEESPEKESELMQEGANEVEGETREQLASAVSGLQDQPNVSCSENMEAEREETLQQAEKEGGEAEVLEKQPKTAEETKERGEAAPERAEEEVREREGERETLQAEQEGKERTGEDEAERGEEKEEGEEKEGRDAPREETSLAMDDVSPREEEERRDNAELHPTSRSDAEETGEGVCAEGDADDGGCAETAEKATVEGRDIGYLQLADCMQNATADSTSRCSTAASDSSVLHEANFVITPDTTPPLSSVPSPLPSSPLPSSPLPPSPSSCFSSQRLLEALRRLQRRRVSLSLHRVQGRCFVRRKRGSFFLSSSSGGKVDSATAMHFLEERGKAIVFSLFSAFLGEESRAEIRTDEALRRHLPGKEGLSEPVCLFESRGETGNEVDSGACVQAMQARKHAEILAHFSRLLKPSSHLSSPVHFLAALYAQAFKALLSRFEDAVSPSPPVFVPSPSQSTFSPPPSLSRGASPSLLRSLQSLVAFLGATSRIFLESGCRGSTGEKSSTEEARRDFLLKKRMRESSLDPQQARKQRRVSRVRGLRPTCDASEDYSRTNASSVSSQALWLPTAGSSPHSPFVGPSGWEQRPSSSLCVSGLPSSAQGLSTFSSSSPWQDELLKTHLRLERERGGWGDSGEPHALTKPSKGGAKQRDRRANCSQRDARRGRGSFSATAKRREAEGERVRPSLLSQKSAKKRPGDEECGEQRSHKTFSLSECVTLSEFLTLGRSRRFSHASRLHALSFRTKSHSPNAGEDEGAGDKEAGSMTVENEETETAFFAFCWGFCEGDAAAASVSTATEDREGDVREQQTNSPDGEGGSLRPAASLQLLTLWRRLSCLSFGIQESREQAEEGGGTGVSGADSCGSMFRGETSSHSSSSEFEAKHRERSQTSSFRHSVCRALGLLVGLNQPKALRACASLGVYGVHVASSLALLRKAVGGLQSFSASCSPTLLQLLREAGELLASSFGESRKPPPVAEAGGQQVGGREKKEEKEAGRETAEFLTAGHDDLCRSLHEAVKKGSDAGLHLLLEAFLGYVLGDTSGGEQNMHALSECRRCGDASEEKKNESMAFSAEDLENAVGRCWLARLVSGSVLTSRSCGVEVSRKKARTDSGESSFSVSNSSLSPSPLSFLSGCGDAKESTQKAPEEGAGCVLSHFFEASHALMDSETETSFFSRMQFWKQLLMAFASATAAQAEPVEFSREKVRLAETGEAGISGERNQTTATSHLSESIQQLARHMRLAIVFRDMLARFALCKGSLQTSAETFREAPATATLLSPQDEKMMTERAERRFREELEQRRQVEHPRFAEEAKDLEATLFLSVALFEVWRQQVEQVLVEERGAREKQNRDREEEVKLCDRDSVFLSLLTEVRSAVLRLVAVLQERR